MKNNAPAKASKAAPSKTNVCGNDTAAKGKAAMNANKDCKEKIDSALEELKPPGPEAAASLPVDIDSGIYHRPED